MWRAGGLLAVFKPAGLTMATAKPKINVEAGATPMEIVSRVAFGISSLGLMAMSLALSFYGAYEMYVALSGSLKDAGDTLLGAIGYLVISLAVFDVAKYFMEEEVIRGRELRIASEARRSLTKFVSTISIAVFIEGLVLVFRASKDSSQNSFYPVLVLLTGILIIIGLGVYQWLSVKVEAQVDVSDKAEERKTR
jgi:hypothetical protein